MSTKADSPEECFVIMPISDQPGYDSGHFGYVYDDLIAPSVEAAGFLPSRADKVKKANNIHIDILSRLHRSPMAICDISSRNPNVFFELAFRQAFDMPVVIIRDEKTESPFDIISIRHIEYNSNLRYHDVIEKRAEIEIFIKETAADKKNNSLISLLSLGEKAKISEANVSKEVAAIEILAKKVESLSYELAMIPKIIDRPRLDLNSSDEVYSKSIDSILLGKTYGEVANLAKKLGIPIQDALRHPDILRGGLSRNINKKMGITRNDD